MTMVDMKMSKKDMAEDAAPSAIGEGNPYPYGLCINLDGDELDKLGFDCQVGDEVYIKAVAKCTSCSENANETSESRHISLQITMLELSSEKEQPGERDTPKAEAGEKKPAKGAMSVLRNAYRNA